MTEIYHEWEYFYHTGEKNGRKMESKTEAKYAWREICKICGTEVWIDTGYGNTGVPNTVVIPGHRLKE